MNCGSPNSAMLFLYLSLSIKILLKMMSTVFSFYFATRRLKRTRDSACIIELGVRSANIPIQHNDVVNVGTETG